MPRLTIASRLTETAVTLPPQRITREMLRGKYLREGESTVDQIFDRVARALASVEEPAFRAEYARRFRENLEAGAIGAGRIMANAGVGRSADAGASKGRGATEGQAARKRADTGGRGTLISCFVQPVGDCIRGWDADGFPGLELALREAMATMRQGGGVGYDFSRIRPRGARGKAGVNLPGGPCAYIDRFDQACASLEAAGARRGAQMGVLRIDHPDVLEFITSKRTPGRWVHFNLSVAVTDVFMEAVEQGSEWPLVHRADPGVDALKRGAHRQADEQWVYGTLPARDLWETVMRSAYDFAEPGVLFLDRIQSDNNLRTIETINATNPCVAGDTGVMTDAGPLRVSALIGRSFNARVNGQVFQVPDPGFVVKGIEPVFELLTREGPSLRLTADHRVRRVAEGVGPGEWVAAWDLRPGDRIVVIDHKIATVGTATFVALRPCGEETVYDVAVPGVHAFEANGFLVHNCGEQPLPPYGSCNLGPIILPRFVCHPFGFGGAVSFDFDAFSRSVALQVRALDNVLDLTDWPLPQQRREAMAKRRIGVGFTGLADALVMLGLRYDEPAGRAMARRIAECMRDTAYRASVSLAVEKGPFPLFDAESVLAEGTFASRLPEDIRKIIRAHGLRNSHLLSVAPTGSVSIAFADNTSSGIEPAFSWRYVRKMRAVAGADAVRSHAVQDHAFRLYAALGGDTTKLPPAFVHALEISPEDHIAMVAAVQPYIDASIAKTVNLTADCAFEDFKKLHRLAWASGLKGLTTYRPNAIREPVLTPDKRVQCP